MMKYLFLLGSLILLAGCCNIEYNGKTAEPLTSEKDVVMYFSNDQYPKDSVAETMGDVSITAGTNWDTQRLQAKLRQFAAEKGANGLLIEKIERIPAGKARPDQIKNLSAKTWNVGDNSQSASHHFREDMLNYSKKEDAEQEIYRIVIRGKLLQIDSGDTK